MDNLTLVRPEHLNHHGYLFGGMLLKWVDENAWMAATREFPGSTLVTIKLEESHFKHPVENGSILRFQIEQVERGTSSVTYCVDVFADAPGAEREKEVFSTRVTFVNLNGKGQACRLPVGKT